MKVWIDQLSCTGSGQCELLAPELFAVTDDGLATVKSEDGELLPEGGEGVGAPVPASLETKVRDAADVCPGACIYLIEEPTA